MTQVRFYHLTTRRLEDVLPTLLGKTLERDKRAVVRLPNADELARMDELLWTFDEAAFLPHGTAETGFEADHPIWLTTGEDNPGGASYLFAADGADILGFEAFDMCAILFDGRDQAAVQSARERWKAVKATPGDHDLQYWQTNGQGKWEQKA